jgi:hypothetical protein
VIQRAIVAKYKGSRKLGAALQSYEKRLRGFFYESFCILGGTE